MFRLGIDDIPVNAIVVVKEEHPDLEYRSWKGGDHLLHLGEIVNMKGHGIFVDRKGRVHWGHHYDEFRMPKKDEL